ncbi:hypothetical protein Hokovirus_1_34 [Hokovirus HKV1]|uniref:Uncharacterized protein n=1 Tax=Hokovirus HKV1 TaxID=1977638 RepID=A0A1V0SEK5_9VIRU|nr:hypothetical protein Hokovirus_1_34 [Hokovirus HKV1]
MNNYSTLTSIDIFKSFNIIRKVDDETINEYCNIIKTCTSVIKFEHIYVLLKKLVHNIVSKNLSGQHITMIIVAYLQNYKFNKDQVACLFGILCETRYNTKFDSIRIIKDIIAKNLDILPLDNYFEIYLRFIDNTTKYKWPNKFNFINEINMKEIPKNVILNAINNVNDKTQEFNCFLVSFFIKLFTKDDIFQILTCFNNYGFRDKVLLLFCDTFTYDKEEISQFIIMYPRYTTDILKKYDITLIFTNQEIIDILTYLTNSSICNELDYLKYINKNYTSIRSYIYENKDQVYQHFENKHLIYNYLILYWYDNNFAISKEEIMASLEFINDNDKITFLCHVKNIFTTREIIDIVTKYNIDRNQLNKLIDINVLKYQDFILTLNNLSPYECFKLIKYSSYIKSDYDTIIDLINKIPLIITNTKLDRYIDSHVLKIELLKYGCISKFDNETKIMQLLNLFEDVKHKKYILNMVSKNNFQLVNNQIFTNIINTINNYVDYYDLLVIDRSVSKYLHPGYFTYNILEDRVKFSGNLGKPLDNEIINEVKQIIIDKIIQEIKLILKYPRLTISDNR